VAFGQNAHQHLVNNLVLAYNNLAQFLKDAVASVSELVSRLLRFLFRPDDF
jgi:mannose/cellobiose epimerase-like protein (N-acyl-D-glucosamine 2-epimerase family)